MQVYLVILGMAVITFGIRYLMFLLAHRIEFPLWFTELLRYVPPAVLSALIVPAVLIPNGSNYSISVTSPQLLGAVAALMVGLKWKNLLAVILTGMGIFWIMILMQ
ncbi:MAG: AzlD domain-containing protein [Spirochaetales bacterium]